MTEKKTVLVIEDEVLTRKLHAQLLKQEGLDPLCIENFQQFISILSEIDQKILGIITDDEIPSQEGEKPSSYARKIIQFCLETGMNENSICLSSGSLRELPEHSLITVVPKKNGYMASLRNFVVQLKEKGKSEREGNDI